MAERYGSFFIDVESGIEESGTESNCNSFLKREEASVVPTIIQNRSEADQAHKDLIVNTLPSYARGVEVANVDGF